MTRCPFHHPHPESRRYDLPVFIHTTILGEAMSTAHHRHCARVQQLRAKTATLLYEKHAFPRPWRRSSCSIYQLQSTIYSSMDVLDGKNSVVEARTRCAYKEHSHLQIYIYIDMRATAQRTRCQLHTHNVDEVLKVVVSMSCSNCANMMQK